MPTAPKPGLSDRARVWVARAGELLRKRRIDRELDEEFRFHLEMEVEHQLRRGLAPAEARRAAAIAFGGVERFREATREARGVAMLDHLSRDTRHAIRRLRRRPGFTLSAVTTIALGIATTAAVGTLAWSVLLAPLPLPDADRLVSLEHHAPGLGAAPVGQSGGTYELYRTQSRSLEAMGAYLENETVSITDGEQPERIRIAMMTPSVLAITGARAAIGRLFTDDDLRREERIVVISHGLWMRRYGGDSTIVGRTIELNRRPSTVLGVLPPSYRFPRAATSVYYGLSPNTGSGQLTDLYLTGIGRLRPGVSPDEAQRELAQLLPRMSELYPAVTPASVIASEVRPLVRGLREWMVADVRDELVMLAVAVGFVLLVATANVLNLFLLRAETLQGEVAVSRALGAGAGALARRFLIEGILVATIGAAVATPLAAWGVMRRFGFNVQQVPRLDEVSAGAALFGFIAALTLAIGLLLGAVALLRATRAPLTELSRASMRTTGGRSWQGVQRLLVTAQVALAVTLLVASATAATSLWRLSRVDLGLDTAQTLAFDLPLPFSAYPSYQDAVRVQLRVLDALRALPGVTGAEAIGAMPLRGTTASMNVRFEGSGPDGARTVNAAISFASGGYFRLLSIPVVAGRAFDEGDLSGVPKAIVSAALARSLAGNGSAIGSTVRFLDFGDAEVRYEIVGVVGDVFGERIAEGPLQTVYFPIVNPPAGADRIPVPFIPREQSGIVVRTSVEPTSLLEAVRRVVRVIDPQLPVARLTTLAALERAATARTRLAMLLLAIAAASSLVLCSVGVFGLVSYVVAGRRRELGIRLALGATPGSIRRLVLREGGVVTAVGATVGLVLAVAFAGLLRAALYAISAVSIGIYAGAAVTILTIAALACWLPARRAGAIEPVTALRSD